ncbi:hypothetical protein J7624_09725 [Wohlfahrtiimonas chitiniclastica]|uniref:hypothetical protein n=1 Tax=Wohlfahrtiimonas chitiniclastica TaxID=400946 RepID=UPI001BCB98C5|nr:hypothetical protein [Wohlfahrtiimonas chitiniclastica]MBS7827421.1 hypothetical protein [Wohlfahrtiimonas chitiniclastica]
MKNLEKNTQAIEHAWKYFELHAGQRITLFNYFLFIMAGLGAAIGAVLQNIEKFLYIGVFVSIFTIIIAIIFWKLDQRTAFLVKQAENILKNLEKNSDIAVLLFSSEEANLTKYNATKYIFNKIITYGTIFRSIFFITGVIGIIGTTIFVLRILGYFDFMIPK